MPNTFCLWSSPRNQNTYLENAIRVFAFSYLILLLLVIGTTAHSQRKRPAGIDLVKPFKDCKLTGSISIYDYTEKRWILSDSTDAYVETLPASTFKIINLLIALETGVIKDENEIVKWVGATDTALYGYRPEIYKDLSVKDAFQISAGWVFIELAKKIGREKYKYYLSLCNYGNQNLSEPGVDFWNIGVMGISPVNQIEFLIKVYENKTPFSKRNVDILKRVMITEKTNGYIIRSKTGWARPFNKEVGWWVGYLDRNSKVYFFATRLIKNRGDRNENFGECRKSITKRILRQLKILK